MKLYTFKFPKNHIFYHFIFLQVFKKIAHIFAEYFGILCSL